MSNIVLVLIWCINTHSEDTICASRKLHILRWIFRILTFPIRVLNVVPGWKVLHFHVQQAKHENAIENYSLKHVKLQSLIMPLVAVWFVVSLFFRDVGSKPTEGTFCCLNFEKNTSFSIPLHLECSFTSRLGPSVLCRMLNISLLFSWNMIFFQFLQNMSHHFQLLKWIPRDLYNLLSHS